ncbi:hypothetical protein SADUNF_Sadunf02G0012400 [Salix dunnii]|uniref:Uncharacterized protein n=1 Tax=Salix dunnii TaxID=1413687 RepID=A0A835N5K8_9ROSI|nr:hypothetical protein SADUNF_Sadunf02G0012400 [Salix dunnii]
MTGHDKGHQSTCNIESKIPQRFLQKESRISVPFHLRGMLRFVQELSSASPWFSRNAVPFAYHIQPFTHEVFLLFQPRKFSHATILDSKPDLHSFSTNHKSIKCQSQELRLKNPDGYFPNREKTPAKPTWAMSYPPRLRISWIPPLNLDILRTDQRFFGNIRSS